jgi:DNA polymerase-4
MFEDTEEMLSLYQAMDRMKKRYGFDAVARCAGATLKVKKANNINCHLITAFAMALFL